MNMFEEIQKRREDNDYLIELEIEIKNNLKGKKIHLLSLSKDVFLDILKLILINYYHKNTIYSDIDNTNYILIVIDNSFNVYETGYDRCIQHKEENVDYTKNKQLYRIDKNICKPVMFFKNMGDCLVYTLNLLYKNFSEKKDFFFYMEEGNKCRKWTYPSFKIDSFRISEKERQFVYFSKNNETSFDILEKIKIEINIINNFL